MDAKDRIIVAVDVKNEDEIKKIVRELSDYVGGFKIGLEVSTAIGAKQAISLVEESGGKVFYDGKFSDIPNTTGGASTEISKPSVDMFNVHINSGPKSVSAAIKNAKDIDRKLIVLGVTVLTSIDEQECLEIYTTGIEETVTRLAISGAKSGLDGIICSANDLKFLNQYPELHNLIKVTPGIRSEWAPANDQKRIATPYDAIRLGADYLVIGRQITQPPAAIGSMADAAILTAKEIDQAIKEMQAR